MHYSIASLWLVAAISALAASSGTANVVLKPSTNGYAVFVNETSITLPSVELGGGSYTVEAWLLVRQVSPAVDTTVFEFGDAHASKTMRLSISRAAGAHTLTYLVRNSAQEQASVSTMAALPLRLWVHVAVVHDASSKITSIFVDGRAQAASSTVPTPVKATRRSMVFARPIASWSQRTLDGLIDDVRIWSTARTAVQIQQTAVSGVAAAPTTRPAGLVLGYDFESIAVGGSGRAPPTLPELSGEASKQASFTGCASPLGCIFPLRESKTVCGDGKRAVGVEGCDDGNTVAGDGCSATCKVETGWFCLPGLPGGTDMCSAGRVLAELNFDGGADLSDAGWTTRNGENSELKALTGRFSGVSGFNSPLGVGALEASPSARFDGPRGLRLWRAPVMEANPMDTPPTSDRNAASRRTAANAAGPYRDGAPVSLPNNALHMWWRADRATTAIVKGSAHATKIESLATKRAGAPTCDMVHFNNLGPVARESTPEKDGLAGQASLLFTTDDEGMRIDEGDGGNLGLGTSGPCVVRDPYTVFTITRFTRRDSMRILSSQDNNWLLGNVDSVIGWHVSGAGWVTFADGRQTYPYYRPDPDFAYLTVAHSFKDTSQSPSQVKTLYRDGVEVGSRPWGGSEPLRLALGSGMRHRNPGDGDLAEVIVFNRSLTDEERWRVEGYLSQRYRHGASPGLLLAAKHWQDNAASLVTQSSRFLHEVDMRRDAGDYAALAPSAQGQAGVQSGTMDEVWLRFASRVEAPAERFGSPLIITLFEDFNGTASVAAHNAVPQIEACGPAVSSAIGNTQSSVPANNVVPGAIFTPQLTCQGRRFYTVCFNGGAAGGRIHCDEVRDTATGKWQQHLVDIGSKFHSKYGTNASIASQDGVNGNWAADGGVPRLLRLSVAAVSADDHQIEAWVDEVRTVQVKALPHCDAVEVSSRPLESALVATYGTLPVAFFALSGASATQARDSRSGWHLDGTNLAAPSSATLSSGVQTQVLPGLTHPTDADGAVKLDPVTTESIRIPAFAQRFSNTFGFTVALWLQITALPTGGSVGSSDPMAGVVIWSDALASSATNAASATSARVNADPGWGTRAVLLANGSVAFSVATDEGVTTVVTRARIPTGKPLHLAGSWEPDFGYLTMFIDGIAQTVEVENNGLWWSGSNFAGSSVNVRQTNIGKLRSTGRALLIGGDGIGAGASTLTGGMVVDDVALWNKALTEHDVARLARPYGIAYVGSSRISTGGEAAVQARWGGKDLWPQLPVAKQSSNGLALWSFDPQTGGLIAADVFPFDSASASTAIEAVHGIASFLNNSAVVPAGAVVVGATRGAGLSAWQPAEQLLFVEEFSDRPDHAPARSRRFWRRTGDGYTSMTSTAFTDGFSHTWEGAKAFCESRGRKMCDYWSYCRPTNWDLNTSTPAYGAVTGEGWTPFDPEDGTTNKWVAIGNAYSDRLCKVYEDVFSSAPTFSDTNPTSGGSILCCRRTRTQEKWREVVQRPPPGATGGRTLYAWHPDAYWVWLRGTAYPSSWHVVTVHGGSAASEGGSMNLYYWNQQHPRGARCQTFIWGSYIHLNVPEAYEWTDYTVTLRAFTSVRDLGVLVRYIDDTNYYGYLTNADPDVSCAGIIKRRGPHWLDDWKQGSLIFEDAPHIGIRTNTWHNFRIAVNGTAGATVRVWVDDQLIISYTDTDASFIAKGSIALWSAYNRPQFDDIRVYHGVPDLVDTAPADSMLRSVGAPPLPRVADGADFYVRPRDAAGAMAFVGRKAQAQTEPSSAYAGARHPLGPVPLPPTTTLSAGDAVRAVPQALFGHPSGTPTMSWPGTEQGEDNVFPAPVAAQGRSVVTGDAPAAARTLMACRKQVLRVPENAPAGTVLALPVRAHPGAASAIGAPIGGFTVVSGNTVTRSEVDPENLAITRVKTTGVFSVNSDDGTVTVVKGGGNTLNAEAVSQVNISVAAGAKPYDSGWVPIHSMQRLGEEGSYRELALPQRFADQDPAALRVDVVYRAADGSNEGYVFRSKGSASWDDDDQWWSFYGGLLSGFVSGGGVVRGDEALDLRWLADHDRHEDTSTPVVAGLRAPTDAAANASTASAAKVRLWAPTFARFARGSIINIGAAQGLLLDSERRYMGEAHRQKSHRAEARVFVTEEQPADFDTGWINVRAQMGAGTERHLRHGLDGFPDRARVLVRAIDGPNAGVVFEAKGDGLSRDYYVNDYGGVMVRISSTEVSVFPPTVYGGGVLEGYSIKVPRRGYGHGVNWQHSYSAEVRVLGWRVGLQAPPTHVTNWLDIEFLQGDVGFKEIGLPDSVTSTGRLPKRVEVWVRSRQGQEYIVPAVGMAENYAHIYWYSMGGIVAAYSNSSVRLWAGGPDIGTDVFPQTEMRPMATTDGWSWPDWSTVYSSIANVQVRVWNDDLPGQADVGEVHVEVLDLQEPPIVKDTMMAVPENVEGSTADGTVVGSVSASDDDAGTVLQFTLISGNPENSLFALHSSTGVVTVANNTLLNFESFAFGVDMLVRVSDGTFEAVSKVHVDITDVNDPVDVFEANLTVPENLALNALVGNPIEAVDPDVDQTILFSIVAASNPNNAFSINKCSGQLRVANPDMLNYELYPDHKIVITVMAVDDGFPQSNDTAQVTINLLDRNDRPTLNLTDLVAPENALAGELVGELPAFDEDNDTLTFIINSGDSKGFFEVGIDGLDSVTGHPRYVLRMSPAVVAWGDGSGRPDLAPFPDANRDGLADGGQLVLNFEDPVRPSLQFKLQIVVFDDSEGSLASRSDVKFYTVLVGDRNDAPVASPSQTRSVPENSPTGTQASSALTSSDDDQFFLTTAGARSDAHTWAWHPDFDASSVPFLLGSTGRITVNLLAASTGEDGLDAERRSSYLLRTVVTDSGGSTNTFMPETYQSALERTALAGRRQGVPLGARKCEVNVTLVVADVNEPPIVEPGALTVAERSQPGTIVGRLNISDPDVADSTLTVTIDASSNPGEAFAVITNDNGTTLTVARDVLDYASRSVYNLVVTAEDLGGLNSSAIIAVSLIDRNDPPRFESCPPAASSPVEFQEYLGVSAVQALLLAPDAADSINTFWFSSDGTFGDDFHRCRAACDANAVCDAWTHFDTLYPLLNWRGQCVGRSGFADVLVGIEAGAAKPDSGVSASRPEASYSVRSGVKIRTCFRVVLDENEATPGGSATLGAAINISDPEQHPFEVGIATAGRGVITGDQAPDKLFRLNSLGPAAGAASSAGAMAYALSIAAPGGLDFERASRHLVYLRVEDNPAAVSGSSGDAEANSTATTVVAIIVRDVNERPVFGFATNDSGTPDSARTSLSVTELDEPGVFVGAPVSCTDQDANTTLTYSLVSGGETYFEVDVATGQISLVKLMDKIFPYVFDLRVRCTDGQLASVARVDIDVIDTNTRPVMLNTASARTIVENAAGGTVVTGTALGVSDPDLGDSHTWQIIATSPLQAAGVLSIDRWTGAIRVGNAAPVETFNFECDRNRPFPGCPMTHRTISVTILLTDSGDGNLTDSAIVTVAVLDVQEAPQLPAAGSQGTLVGATPVSLHLEVYENSQPGSMLFWAPALSNPASLGGATPEADFYDDDKTPLGFSWLSAGSPSVASNLQGVAASTPANLFLVSAGNRTPTTSGSSAGVGQGAGDASVSNDPIAALSPAELRAYLNRYPLGQTPVFALTASPPTSVLSVLPDSAGRMLDYERASRLTILLSVTDADGFGDTSLTVTVDVLDRPERPVLFAALPEDAVESQFDTAPATVPAGPTTAAYSRANLPPGIIASTVREGSPGGFVVANISGLAFDPDGDKLWYMLLSVDQIRASQEVVPEQPDVLTGQLAATFEVQDELGGLLLRPPAFGASSVVDFEQFVGFNVTVRVSDRPVGSSGSLWVDVIVMVSVEDVNDMVIASVTTPGGPLQTTGGETVVIRGIDLGFTHPMPQELLPDIEAGYDCSPGPRAGDAASLATAPWVPSTFGRDPFVSTCRYTARNCRYTSEGTEITCFSAEGAGRRHLWRVRVTWSAGGGVPSERHSNPSADSEDFPQVTSYAPPSVRGIRYPVLGLRTVGGDVVDLVGANMGPAGSAVEGSMAAVLQPSVLAVAVGAAARAVSVSPMPFAGATTMGSGLSGCIVRNHTNVQCQAGAGVGAGYFWVVSVESQPSETREQYQQALLDGAGQGVRLPFEEMLVRYRVPTIAALESATATPLLDLAAIPTLGGARALRLRGEDFGPEPPQAPAGVVAVPSTGGVDPLLVVYAYMQGLRFRVRVLCSVDAASPHQALLCDVPAAVGRDFTWSVVVGGQASAQSGQSTHYRGPAISRVFGTGAVASPTRGGARLFIEGTNFGPVAIANAEPVAPFTEVPAPVDWAAYGNASLHAGGFSSPPAEAGAPVSGWVRATGCVVATGHNLIQCSTGEGAGHGHALQVSVGAQRSTLIRSVVTYGPPFVTHTSGQASPAARTQGGEWVVLNGANMGPSLATLDVVSYGPTGTEFPAAACQMLEPHRSVNCTTPEGAGKDLRFKVVVAGIHSAAPRTQYAPPTITGVRLLSPLSAPGAFAASVSGLNTRGGQRVELEGDNLGSSISLSGYSYLDRVAYGPYVLSAAGCNASSDPAFEHSRIECVTLPGVGAEHALDVSVGLQDQGPSPITVSFGAPHLLALILRSPARDAAGPPASYGLPAPPRMHTSVPTSGGVLRIVAFNLGRAVDGLRVWAGTEASTKEAQPITYAELPCDRNGDSGGAVMVPAQWRPRFEAQFPSPPGAAALSPGGAYPPGTDFPVTAFARDLYCADVLLPAGDGRIRDVWAEVGSQQSSKLAYSYADPFVRDLVVIEDPLDAIRRVVVLKGGDFGLATNGLVLVGACGEGNATVGVQLAARMDGGDVVLNDWVTETSARATMAAAETEPGVVRVNCGTSGGAGVGPVVTLVECVVDGESTDAGQTYWRHTEVRCRVPRIRRMDDATSGADTVPIRQGYVVAVSGIDKRTTRVHPYTESSPVVLEHTPVQSPSHGGVTVTVVGEFLSGWPNRAAVAASIRNDSLAILADPADLRAWAPCAVEAGSYREQRDDGSECDTATSESGACTPRTRQRASFRCKTPPGVGSEATSGFRVNRFEQVSEDVAFSFAPPTLETLSGRPSIGQGGWITLGGPLVTLTGRDLGAKPVVEVNSSLTGKWERVPGELVTLTGVQEHDSLQFVLPPGSGVDRAVHVVAGDQTSNRLSFSYDPPRLAPYCTVPQTLSGDTRGGLVISVCGFGFGPAELADVNGTLGALPDMRARSFVQVGGRRVPAISWNHSYVVFRMPEGQGVQLDIVVTADGQRSDTPPPGGGPFPNLPSLRFTYQQPQLDSVAPLSGPSSAVDTETGLPLEIELRGENFGVNPVLTFGGRALPLLEATHTLVRALVPPGQGSASVSLDVGTQTFSAIPLFVYDKPQALHLLTSQAGRTDACSRFEDVRSWRARLGVLPPAGDSRRLCCAPQLLRISGESFGVVTPRVVIEPPASLPLQAAVAAGLTEAALRKIVDRTCAEVEADVQASWGEAADLVRTGCVPYEPCIASHTHTNIMLRAPAGQGTGMTVSVLVQDLFDGQQVSGRSDHNATLPEPFSYNKPVIQQVESSPFDGLGAIVTLRGVNLGYDDALFQTFAYGEVDEPLPFANLQAEAAAARARREAGDLSSLSRSSGHQSSAVDAFPVARGLVTATYTARHARPARVLQQTADPGGEVAEAPPAELRSDAARQVLSVLVSGAPCDALDWARDSQAGDPKGAPPYLRCRLNRAPVGHHNLTVTIAGTTQTHLADVDGLIQSSCFEGAYGLNGEACLPCPSGAQCPGSPMEPAALKGFWLEGMPRSDAFYDQLCPLERQSRTLCPLVVSCVPNLACVGNNTCALGYEGERCSQCLRGKYYRVNGDCIPCPDNPELIAAFFAVGIVCVCFGAYEMNRRQLNLGWIAIGLDYFQVLSLFSNVKVNWPPFLLSVFRFLSVFNLNLDITAPECWAEGITFTARWYATIAMPAAACFLIALVWIFKATWTRCCKCQSLVSMAPVTDSLISACTTIYYVSYLLIARATVDVLSCAPSQPPDPRGRTFMESTAIACFEAGGEHMAMFPFALLSLCVFNIGIPLAILRLLYNNRGLIKEDQYLRAMDTGDSKSTNPNALRLRKRWMRLYYLFKPRFSWFFVQVIFIRKLGLAFAALAFRSAPSLQLAVALLVTFYSFVLTVRLKPYLCFGEARDVLADHERLAAIGSPLHSKINTTLRDVRATLRGKDIHRRGNDLWRTVVGGDVTLTNKASGKGATKDMAAKSAAALRGAAGLLGRAGDRGSANSEEVRRQLRRESMHSNLNTMDSVLMATASLITLGGLLYESGSFSDRDASVETLMVTILLVGIMLGGTIYFFTAATIEVLAEMRPGTCLKPKVRKQAKLDTDAARRRMEAAALNRMEEEAAAKAARGGVASAFSGSPAADASPSAQPKTGDRAALATPLPRQSPKAQRAASRSGSACGCVARLLAFCPCSAVPVDDPFMGMFHGSDGGSPATKSRRVSGGGKAFSFDGKDSAGGDLAGDTGSGFAVSNPMSPAAASLKASAMHGVRGLSGVGVNEAMAAEMERQQQEAAREEKEALKASNLRVDTLPDEPPKREFVEAWLARFKQLQGEADDLGRQIRDVHRAGSQAEDDELKAAIEATDAAYRRRRASTAGSDESSKRAAANAREAARSRRKPSIGARDGGDLAGVNPMLAAARFKQKARGGAKSDLAATNPMFAASSRSGCSKRGLGDTAASAARSPANPMLAPADTRTTDTDAETAKVPTVDEPAADLATAQTAVKAAAAEEPSAAAAEDGALA